MSTCFFLDGPEAGKMIFRKDLPPAWDFPTFQGLTKIDFDPHLESQPLPLTRTRYKLSFVSIGGEWGLYTLAGRPDYFMALGRWVSKPRELKRPEPVYFEHGV